ncbi:MAG: hypothetical protein NDI61_00235 [Bdellovibrionaceae bacterium]|nr:hypothetical protein [Pseudobdellovibrionaceae bacterium]
MKSTLIDFEQNGIMKTVIQIFSIMMLLSTHAHADVFEGDAAGPTSAENELSVEAKRRAIAKCAQANFLIEDCRQAETVEYKTYEYVSTSGGMSYNGIVVRSVLQIGKAACQNQ